MTETDTYIQFEIVNVKSSTVVWNHRQSQLFLGLEYVRSEESWEKVWGWELSQLFLGLEYVRSEES